MRKGSGILLTRNCRVCDKIFTVLKSQTNGGRWRNCSTDCSAIARSLNWGSIEDRFWSRVNKDGPLLHTPELSPCWEYTTRPDEFGYGRINFNRYYGQRAHIYSWELHNGSRNGLKVLHHCDNTSCIRPSHLFLGTQTDNLHDMYDKGRGNSWGHKQW